MNIVEVENKDEEMEMEVDNSEDEESIVATSNFDMKKFRQNLKKGNFFDGKFRNTINQLDLYPKL